MSQSLWLALALVLVFEGVLPLIAPGAWRRMFSQILQLHDGQIRFFGLLCVLAGALLAWLLG